MRRYGMPLLLRHQGEKQSVWGFLQHSGSKSLQNSQIQYSQLGEVPGGYYLYIGPVIPTQTGDVLIGDGKVYELRRVETVRFGNHPVYLWGLCVEKGSDDLWGS